MTAGLHVELNRDGPSATNLVVGGANKIVKFPISSFLHLEDRESGNDEALVELVINPPSINFPANKFVTDWQPITEMFRDLHVTNGAIVRWSEKQVLCRFRFRSNLKKDGSSRPTLLLEALVLITGTWEAVPESKKQLLSMDRSLAIKLTSVDLSWYSPIPAHRLVTAMGYSRLSVDVPVPEEFRYRWIIQVAMKKSDGGKSAETREEYEAYIARDIPYHVITNNDTPFALPYPFMEVEVTDNSQGKPVKFWRNGKVITRSGPNKRKATPSQPNKFNTNPKGIRLTSSCLPEDAPQHLKNLAENLFEASVAASTARKYSTAANHVAQLELDLGRELPFPLSPADSTMLLMHLVSKGLCVGTVRSYMAGARRLAIASGVETPAPRSDLARSLLKGYENLKRDPKKAAMSSTHRPVSIHFLRLLGHAASTYWEGDSFDKLSFWVVCLTAFWGSLRIGEVLGQRTSIFSPGSDLLASDVLHMSKTSFAWWIRDPKVSKDFGDVIEIWSTPQFPDIDPFTSFGKFWRIRNQKGFPMTSPLFMRSKGDILTSQHFNRCLQSLISHYALELELTINDWTGHSFRSGLPTLLQSLGFSEENIKAWGRWSSSVFQIYSKDIERRMEVQRGILKVMAQIKAHIDGTTNPP